VTKAHLVDQLAAGAELTKQESDKIVGLLISAITKALADGEKLEIRGFGSFKVKDRKSRVARNPRTGETVQVPAQRVATFRPSKELGALLNPSSTATDTAKE
jgi:integration host factor subunit beta